MRVPVVYAFASFLAATLLFAIQPWAGKVLLPRFGGSAAVWLTTLLFFQTALVVGYLYAHKMRDAPRALHPALLLVTAVVPFAIGATYQGPAVLAVLAALTANISMFAILLAATTPLLHSWLARGEELEPYALYAASNAGSLLGLLVYPFVIEPWTTLDTQSTVWRVMFIAVAVVIGACALMRPRTVDALPASPHPVAADAAPSRWFLMSFVPASLLYGFTAFITRDIAALPLLWVLPLAVYLVTFIVAFGVLKQGLPSWFAWFAPVVLYVTALTSVAWPSTGLTLGCHLVAFTVFALYFHGELSRMRPASSDATAFYLWVSFGGVSAGVFNAVLAPLIFSAPHEYALTYGLALILIPARYGEAFGPAARRALHGIMMVALAVAFALAPGGWGPKAGVAMMMGLAFVVALGLPALSHVMLAVFLGAVVTYPGPAEIVDQRRSFYGTHTVEQRTIDSHEMRALVDGVTQHGIERVEPPPVPEPLGYYHPDGPSGAVLRQVLSGPGRRVALVGLGIGSMALYSRREDTFDFFELDPTVVELAREHFRPLAQAAGSVRVDVMDGRLGLGRTADASFDLIVVDAFSSDAIPTHLLTVEAIAFYGAKLADGGLLLVHTSNRYLDIDRVAIGALSQGGWLHRQRHWNPGEERPVGAWPSSWVVATPPGGSLGALGQSSDWQELRSDIVWTDAYSSVVGALR